MTPEERCHDSHGTPTGEWESTVDDWPARLAQIVAQAVAKKERKRTEARQRKARRDAGLKRRHATKLERTGKAD